MELIHCTPYIRFADQVCFVSQRGPSKTYDCRLLYTFHGKAEMRLNGSRHTMTHGSLVMFQPGTTYTILPDPSVTMLILDFDFTQDYAHATEFLLPCPVEHFRPEEAHKTMLFSDVPQLNDPLYLENTAFLENAFQEIIAEFRQKRLFFRGKTSAQFKTILFELARFLQPGSDNRSVVSRVLDYIEHNLSRPLTNKEIGEALNYNPNYLNRLILQHTGMSLHQYLLQRRLSLAAVLLQSTEQPVHEIAISLGFHSASHFSNYFKNSTGSTPAQYRKNGTL